MGTKSMNEATSEPVVATTGQSVILTFAPAVALPSTTTVTFRCFQLADDTTSSATGEPLVSWEERLDVSPAGRGRGGRRWEAKWAAGVESQKTTIPEQSHIVYPTAKVTQRGPSKRVEAMNPVRIPAIAVTSNPKFTEIMQHEFFQQTVIVGGGSGRKFHPEPLRAFIRSLTPQQRALLCSYDKDRLVVFITLRGARPERPMYADNLGPQTLLSDHRAVVANADFSVFWCHRKGQRVELACHTEHFCVNTRHSPLSGTSTSVFLETAGDMSPGKHHPKRYLLGTRYAAGYVPYLTLLNSKGESVMGKKTTFTDK